MLNTLTSGTEMEQYRLALHILEVWAQYRMPVIIALVVCIVLTLFMFIRKMRGRFLFFLLSLLLGGLTGGMEWFKEYIKKREKEKVARTITALPRAVGKVTEKVTKPITTPLKKIFPFGKNKKITPKTPKK